MPIAIVNTFPTNAQGRGMAFKGADLWLAVFQINFPPVAGSLEQINRTTGAAVDHSAGTSPFAFQAIYDAAHNQFWTTPAGGAPITELALYDGTGTLISNPSNPAGDNPYGMAITPTHLWVGNTGSFSFSVFNAVTGAFIATVAIASFGPTTGIGNMAYDGSSVWCPIINNELIQLDDVTMTVLNDFTVAGVNRFGGIIFAGGNLWATDRNAAHLLKLDLAGNVLNTYNTLGGSPGPLAFDGTYLWILDFGGTVSAYSLAGVLQAGLAIPGSPQGIGCDGATGSAWASVSGPDEVVHIQFTATPPPPSGSQSNVFVVT